MSDHCQPEAAAAVVFLPKRVCGALGMPPRGIGYYIVKELSVISYSTLRNSVEIQYWNPD